MFIDKAEAKRHLEAFAPDLIAALRERFEQFFAILNGDDWSLVIKSHAMIEAAVTELVLEHLGQPALRPVVERLPLSDARTGKVTVARALGLLRDDQCRFVRSLSELRNSLVHRVENLDFDLQKHLRTLDPGKAKAWKSSLIWFAHDEPTRSTWNSIVDRAPQAAVFMAATLLVADCTITSREDRASRELKLLSQKTMKAIFAEPLTKAQKPRRAAARGGRRRRGAP